MRTPSVERSSPSHGEASREGTGLVLSQVYGFIKQSGGHIKIYFEVGSGTTTRVYLPRTTSASVTAQGEQIDASELVTAQREKILVVEDHDDVRAQSVNSLRELGYEVFEAGDARSAMRTLEQQQGALDLLFTDVVLPGGISGAQLAAQAEELASKVRHVLEIE